MILYGLMDSPFVRRVAVTLCHYGLKYERSALSVFRDADALRAVNPLGKAPALELDDGELIFDSEMILDHLDAEVGPARALMPAAGPERRAHQRVVTVALGLAEKSVALNGELNRRAAGKIDPDWVARHQVQIASALDWLEATLAGPWMMGPDLSQADITTVTSIGHVEHRHSALFDANAVPRLAELAARAETQAPFNVAPFSDS